MDLSTIRRKLDSGQYKDPWEYVDDVWLMFDNAWLYNRKTSRVYKYCTKVSIESWKSKIVKARIIVFQDACHFSESSFMDLQR